MNRKPKIQSKTISPTINKNKTTVHVEPKDDNTKQSTLACQKQSSIVLDSDIKPAGFQARNLQLKLKPAVCQQKLDETASTTNKSRYKAHSVISGTKPKEAVAKCILHVPHGGNWKTGGTHLKLWTDNNSGSKLMIKSGSMDLWGIDTIPPAAPKGVHRWHNFRSSDQ